MSANLAHYLAEYTILLKYTNTTQKYIHCTTGWHKYTKHTPTHTPLCTHLSYYRINLFKLVNYYSSWRTRRHFGCAVVVAAWLELLRSGVEHRRMLPCRCNTVAISPRSDYCSKSTMHIYVPTTTTTTHDQRHIEHMVRQYVIVRTYTIYKVFWKAEKMSIAKARLRKARGVGVLFTLSMRRLQYLLCATYFPVICDICDFTAPYMYM